MRNRVLAFVIVTLLASACGGGQTPTSAPAPASTQIAGGTSAPASASAPPVLTPARDADATNTVTPEPTITADPTSAPPAPSPVEPSPTATSDVVSNKVIFATDDGASIAATLLGEGDIAVLLLHQGFGNATQRSWHPFARLIAGSGLAALTVDFRGRGGSKGSLGKDYRARDARAAVEFLRERGLSRLVCMGAGIWGGEPCLRLALEGSLEGLVLVSTPMSGVSSEQLTEQDLSQLTIPKLFVYGEKDAEGVCAAMTEMHRNSAEPKGLISFDSAARGTELFRSPHVDDFRQVLLGFLEEHWQSAGSPSLTAPSPVPAANPSLGDTRTRSGDGMVMVYVPGGEFLMGSSKAEIEAQLSECDQISSFCSPRFYKDESPQHPVTLDGFWMDQTEVTNAQFAVFMNEYGNRSENGVKLVALDEGYIRIKVEDGEYLPMTGAGDHPVVMASWHGANAYCRGVGGRLPTEAEWEYAARGPEGRIYPWGDDAPTCELANSGACTGSTVSASSLPDGASWCAALGLAGNAWEWVADRFGRYPAAHQANPAGASSGTMRVLRGGGWHANRWQVRTTFRLHDTSPSSHVGCIGFRCVVTHQE